MAGNGNWTAMGLNRSVKTRASIASSAKRWLGGLLSARRTALLPEIANISPDAIVITDANGIIRSFNPAAENLFGYAPAEVVGRNVKMLMPPHSRSGHDAHVSRYLATGQKRIIGTGRVVAGEKKDGSSVPLEIFVIESRLGPSPVFVAFIHDVTELQVEKRRVQELQRQLFQFNRLAEMGQVASGLAHEVNQPLTAIIYYLQAGRQLLATGATGAARPIDGILEKVEAQANRAADIVKRLRAFIDRRDGEHQCENLVTLIEEALALAIIGKAGRETRLKLELADTTPPVIVDRVQIQQVIVNLVQNAVHAMEGLPRRELTISTAAESADFVRVAIKDVGTGIAPEIAGKLFGEFVTTKEDGLGVGLSICKAIIDNHGGKIWAEANPGGGTTFQFTIPVYKAPDE
jgi:two-component system, LuxR family, sensor kinase FixL